MAGVLFVVRIWEVTGLFASPRVVFAPYVAFAPHGLLAPHVVVGPFVVVGVVGRVPADAVDTICHLRTAAV